MLDDLHEVQSAACHDALSVVISAVPQGSQLAAASRFEQPHLPRLRALGDALELGPSDLALDADGAWQVFRNAQVSLPPERAATLTVRTEGWPVGLYLAALITRESHGRAGTVTGDDRYVADYLYREALIRQPKAIQRFLRRTAVLDQLSAPLCAAILQSAAAPAHLRHVEAQGLFLLPLDRRREWYRYHELFREFLLGELRHTEPGIVTALHQRAADWYEANGSPALAVEHLLNTTDWDRTLPLVTKLSLSTYMAGHFSTVQRWHRMIGDSNIERYPPLAVYRCYEYVLTGDTTAALRWAAVVDAASFDGVPPDGTSSFDSARAMLRACMCADGPDRMMADTDFAAAQEQGWSQLRDTALFLLAEAHLLAGQTDEARARFAEAATAAVPMGNSDTTVACESQLASLAMDQGDWPEAADRLDVALATIEKKRMHGYAFSSATWWQL